MGRVQCTTVCTFSAPIDRAGEQRVASIDRYLISSAQAGGRDGRYCDSWGGGREARAKTTRRLNSAAGNPMEGSASVSANNASDFLFRLASSTKSRPPTQTTQCPRNPGDSPISSSRLKNKALSDVIRRGHRENPEAKRRVRERAESVDLGWNKMGQLDVGAEGLGQFSRLQLPSFVSGNGVFRWRNRS